MQVTITALNRKERVSSRTGKPFTSLGIKTDKHADKWLSGFDGAETKDWKVGDAVEIEVATKGEYLNFSVPKKAAATGDQFATSNAEIKNLLTFKVIPMLEAIYKQHEALKREPAYDIDEADRAAEEMEF